MKAPAADDDRPSAFVTCTLTFPERCGGTVATNCTELTILTFFAATPPKLTEGGVASALDEKFDPLMVTAAPPAGEAELGTMDFIVGADAC